MSESPSHQPVVLIIDDEIQMRRLLRVTLEGNGYRVFEADSGQAGLVEAAQRRPDIVVLDLGLPDMDGLAVLRRLREWSETPVLVLSVREGEEDKVGALDRGADDYMNKPFSTAEFLARLRAARRRAQPAGDNAVFVSGPLQVDFSSRAVTIKGKEIKLTPTEYSLLRLLARNAGKVVTHGQILKEVWGPNYGGQTHYLRVYMAHLREKLETDSSRPELLLTESGIGYRMKAEA
ncbi:MAG TPA: response regulator [Verrucomicrobiae bacterium]|jgi:two-component system KDP operon response regulator KdpE